MQIRFRLVQLDTHAHLDVFVDRSAIEAKERRGAKSGTLVVRADELGEFRDAILHGVHVSFEQRLPGEVVI